MGGAIYELLREAARQSRSAGWHQPLGIRGLRRDLLATYRAGRDIFGHPFRYPPADVGPFRDSLRAARELSVKIAHPGLRAALLTHLDGLQVRADLAAHRSDTTYSANQAESEGHPSQETLRYASDLLLVTPHEDATQATFPSVVLKGRVQQALQAYALDASWYVEEHQNMVGRASVNGAAHRIRIRAGTRYSQPEMDRLVVHEVGGHVLRWANSLEQPNPLARLQMGTKSTLTEEGIALWGESQLKVTGAAFQRIFALRSLAVDAARSAGIMDVVRLMTKWVDDETSVDIALRVKRGLVDPDGPGGLSKDHAYLTGQLEVERVAAQGRLSPLLVVKWGVEHLDLAEELVEAGELMPPARHLNSKSLGIDASQL